MKSYLIILFISLFTTKAFCQNEDKIISGLNNIVKPITTVHPEDSFSDIEFIKDVTKDLSIIGIGESTHGTAFYNTYRQRLIRFLVQEMDYKAIIDEGDILAAEKVYAYINNQTDSLELIGGLRPVITNKKELDWLRAYNKDKSENERVHIYGAEVRGFYGIIRKLEIFSVSNNTTTILEKFKGDVGVGYKNLSKKDFEEIKMAAEKMGANCNSSLCSYYLLYSTSKLILPGVKGLAETILK